MTPERAGRTPRPRGHCAREEAFSLCHLPAPSRLLTPAPAAPAWLPRHPLQPYRRAEAREEEVQRPRGAGVPRCLCICQRRQGGQAVCSGSPPAPVRFCPVLPPLTLCPRVAWGGRRRAPSRWRDCAAEAPVPLATRRAGARTRAGLTVSRPGPWKHLAQAFYTLQCNFSILFYSDYDYSGILSLG